MASSSSSNRLASRLSVDSIAKPVRTRSNSPVPLAVPGFVMMIIAVAGTMVLQSDWRFPVQGDCVFA
ncbi:hypothetical protein D3C76_1773180 [compost metagenome]